MLHRCDFSAAKERANRSARLQTLNLVVDLAANEGGEKRCHSQEHDRCWDAFGYRFSLRRNASSLFFPIKIDARSKMATAAANHANGLQTTNIWGSMFLV
jgi:hypothetical protein